MKELLVIDGSSLLFRAFYALPLLMTKQGLYTNAIYGFVQMLENAVEKFNPEFVAVCFDKPGGTFRNEIFQDYKGTRQSTPTELSQQIPIIKDILKQMNISILESDEYEADDIAGTLAKKAEQEGIKAILVTGDRDYLQLVGENTEVVLTKKGIKDLEIYDYSRIKEEYGLTPGQLIDLKGLMGDSSDNIPGVPGVGEKTGIKLLLKYNNIDSIYSNIEDITGKKLKSNLENFRDQAYMSYELGKIVQDVPLELTIKDLERKEYNLNNLVDIYKQYEFNQLLKRLPLDNMEPENKEIIQQSSLLISWVDDTFDPYSTGNKVFLRTYDDQHLPRMGNVKIIAVSDGETHVHIYRVSGTWPDQWIKWFQDDSIEKIAHGIKDTVVSLLVQDIDIRGVVFDGEIAAYLLDPTRSDYQLGSIADSYGINALVTREAIVGKGKSKKKWLEIDEKIMEEFIANEINALNKIYPILSEKIQSSNMENLFYELELPLMSVLAEMEYIGVKVNKDELKELDREFQKEIIELENDIYNLAGTEFNINSPKQLGEILFDELKLPVIKKNKTGFSTDAEVLDKLKNEHEIIDLILRYRQLSKLKSTYLDGLIQLINPKTGRVHSRFAQTVTATGRLSSLDPNLQNIPIRTEEGRQIRKAFCASPGKVFIDADYSQIELRVLAHIANDKVIKYSFYSNLDIHSTTASQVFNLNIDEVDSEHRRRAKAVNFGIVYGISDYGLSQDLNITRKEAKEYIDSYLEKFVGVKSFMDEIVLEGAEKGYVETLLHRRRYIPELSSKNFNIRGFGKRIALNTPIQGTAADIIKIAMIRVSNCLKKEKIDGSILIQVHDELIVEVNVNQLDDALNIVKEEMEKAISLSVPLKVDVNVGDNWYGTK
ncbi:MAG: DNA polymerase I [Tissierellia bacterium]|nr:DNA polymerase I [Tissierellia bacterium]